MSLPRLNLGRRGECQRGASSTEYALLLSLIALFIIGGLTYLGTRTSDLYNAPCAELIKVGKSC